MKMNSKQFERYCFITKQIKAKFSTMEALAKAVGLSRSGIGKLVRRASEGDNRAMQRVMDYIENTPSDTYTEEEFARLKALFQEKLGGSQSELHRLYQLHTGKNSRNPHSALVGRKPRKATKTILLLTKIFNEL